MLNAAITTDAFLIGARVEESQIQRIFWVVFRQINGVDVLLGVVVIVAIASDTTQQYAFKRLEG